MCIRDRHQAASAGHVGIVQTLLDAGADVHKRDEAGLDAWLLAAPAGQLGVMEALLDAGANPDAVDGEGRDALMRALDEGQASAALARWLRERGMDTQRLDVHGERCLLYTSWRSWPLWSRAFAGELDSLRDWRRVIEIDPAAWRGLKSALPATALVGGGIALGWPELMPMPLRWGLACPLYTSRCV